MEAIRLFIKIKSAENRVFEAKQTVKELDEQISVTTDQITEAYENGRSVDVLSLCDKSDAMRAKRTKLERKIKQAQKEIEQLKNEFNDHRSESLQQIKELHAMASWGY